MATVVSQVGQGHYYVACVGRMIKRSPEQWSHVTERERLAQEGVRESQDPGQDTGHVIGEPELLQQPSKFSEHGPNVDALVRFRCRRKCRADFMARGSNEKEI